jgi:hypothetical protein
MPDASIERTCSQGLRLVYRFRLFSHRLAVACACRRIIRALCVKRITS